MAQWFFRKKGKGEVERNPTRECCPACGFILLKKYTLICSMLWHGGV